MGWLGCFVGIIGSFELVVVGIGIVVDFESSVSL